MKKMYKRTLAVLLAALMTAGNLVVPTTAGYESSEPVYTFDTLLAPAADAKVSAMNVKPFTSTEDLIQDSIKYILENGVAPTGDVQEDWLAVSVEEQTGKSLDVVMSEIFRGIANKDSEGYVDTSAYHLDEALMEDVMARLVKQYYLSTALEYSLDVYGGEAVGIFFELKEALSIAFDEIDVNAELGNDETAISDAVERAEANAAQKFYGETNFEGEEPGEGTGEDEADVCLESADGKHVYVEHTREGYANEADYIQTAATCKNPAVYYKSCEFCKKINLKETFVDPEGELADHTIADDAEWYFDAEDHWKVCSVCEEEIRTVHTEAEDWKSDAENHWKYCTVCGAVLGEAVAHTPKYAADEEAETHAVTCEVCAYVIEENGRHVYDQEVAEGKYSAEPADCTNAATYYYSCLCGAKGTETFSYGEAKGHSPADVWTKDSTHHWHVCTVCDASVDKAEHTPDHEEATEDYAVRCNDCGYLLAEQLPHTHVYGTDDVVVEWAADYTSCKATFTCTKCDAETEGHTYTETTTDITSVEAANKDVIFTAQFVTENYVAETTVKHVHKYNPDDETTYSFRWTDYRTMNDDTNGNGQLDPEEMSLVYDPTYDPANDPSYDPETGMGKYVMYDPNTGIGVSAARKIVVASDGLTFKCTECGEETVIAGDDENLHVETRYLDATGNPATDPNAVIMEIMIAAYAVSPEVVFSANIDAAEYRLKIHWNEMTEFVRANPQYYGISADFWTSKNTDASPLGAIKTLCNMADLVFVPNTNMDFMVDMLNQAFISYVMQYGYMLLYKVQDAMSYIDSSMTDVQKMLVMHDWLAKNASFDMNSLVAQKSDPNFQMNPLTMTPFAALLWNELGMDGAVCLGYAAAYTYLLQYAFPENYRNGNEWKTFEESDHIVDFVQIKFHTNVADSSVAGENSGFGDGDAVFNEPHYFNAVRLPGNETGHDGDYWYYTDACYDDINVEVISQYRVETDGNISHMYFLSSPQSFVDQFEGNFDYFDSAYDGWRWDPNYILDENGQPQVGQDGKLITEKDEDGFTIYYQSENQDEVMYDDDQFEQTWFSNAVSEIVFDEDCWYYVTGSANSYASLKDLFGDEESGDGGNNSGMGDMDMDMMLQYKNDPEYADMLVYRARKYGDRPVEDEENNNNQMGGFSQYEDPYAKVLFHFGYGTIGEPETDADGNAQYGPYYDLIEEDLAFRDVYPDLCHALAKYGDELYFSVSDRIMVYNLKRDSVKQLKEYNTVHAMTTGKAFTGMSFFTTATPEDANYTFTVENHPISSLAINEVVTWERDAQGNPVMDENGQPIRYVTPSLYVSIGTNYSNSYAVNDVSYVEEAINFNPNYYRFMEDEEEEEEPNKNTEFMWCANIVDIMPMEDMLDDLNNSSYETVSVDAICGYASFEEPRSAKYGLSDGTQKVEGDDAALEHHYILDRGEDCYICFRCLDCVNQTEVDENEIPVGHIYNENGVFEWSEDYSSCILHRGCMVVDCEEHTADACTVTSEEKPEEEVITYTATFTEGNTTYTDVVDVSTHTHSFSTEPVFNWVKDEEGNWIVTAEFGCVSEKCPVEGFSETVDCTVDEGVEGENGNVTYTATCEFNGETYSDTLVDNAHVHTLGEYEFIWAQNDEGAWTAKIKFTCTAEDCPYTEDQKSVTYDADVEETVDEEAETITYTATYIDENDTPYTDTKVVSTHKHNQVVSEFIWTETEEGWTAVVVLVCDSEICPEEDYTETVDCEVTEAVDEEAETITYTAAYGEFTDTKVVSTHKHNQVVSEFIWTETEEGWTAVVVLVCDSEICPEEDYTETCDCEVTEAVDEEAETITYTAAYGEFTDTKVVSTHKHNQVASEFIWTETEEGWTAVVVLVCDSEICPEEDYTETVDCEVTEAVDEEAETITYTAVYGEFTDTKVVNIHEHVYGEPEFNWSEDAVACTAVFTCTTCEEFVEVACTVDKRTDYVTGDDIYSAICAFQGNNYSAEKVVEHTEHIYDEPEFNWAEDKSACEAVFTCTKCSDAVEGYTVTVECEVEIKIAVKPTSEEKGLKQYIATCTFNGEEYSDILEEEISSLGSVELSVSDLVVKAGHEAQMTISIDSLPAQGLSYLQLEIDYDQDYLTLVNAEATSLIGIPSTSENMDDKPYIVMWDTIEELNETGVILTLTFEAVKVESFTETEDIITITCNECLDLTLEDITCNISDYETVIMIPGDVNADGTVSGKDLILMRQFVAEIEGTVIVEEVADVNADGEINGKDVIVMRQYLAMWDDVVLQ